MTKWQFSMVLGLACQTGCVIYDETLRRDASDAAVDALRDDHSATDALRETPARTDATAFDVEAAGDAGADAGTENDGSLTDTRDGGDANTADDARDATTGPIVDGPQPEGSADAHADMAVGDGGGGSGDDATDAPFDAPRDAPIVGCTVEFTVSGVTWDEDGPTADSGSRGVQLVGDIGSFGAWDATSGVALMEKAPGAWSANFHLSDRLSLQFKFVKMEFGRPPEWEEWLPFDSNRSLMVDCRSDGGTIWVDAATETGPANRAVGRSYGGAFGIRPLDATK
jgi:hypothetical protein